MRRGESNFYQQVIHAQRAARVTPEGVGALV
jgi:hypothetical protein